MDGSVVMRSSGVSAPSARRHEPLQALYAEWLAVTKNIVSETRQNARMVAGPESAGREERLGELVDDRLAIENCIVGARCASLDDLLIKLTVAAYTTLGFGGRDGLEHDAVLVLDAVSDAHRLFPGRIELPPPEF